MTPENHSAVDELRARLERRAPLEPIPVTPASGFAPARWDLIWRERFPARALSVVAGPPGQGKSTLEAAIAAELSQAGHIGIISNLEDDPEAVTLPRLMAAGANLERVMIISRESAPQMPADFDRLEQLVISTNASFVILDPIAAHFSPENRVHNRAALGQLMAMAGRRHCAVIGIHHTTKTRLVGREGISAVEVVGGPTGGLSGAARAVYLYGRDPRDEDRRALACVKINGVERPGALVVEHDTVELAADGLLLEAGVLRFVEEANIDPERVLGRGQTKRERDEECAEWLTDWLAAGEECARPSNEVRLEARRVGFAWQTVLRASIEIGVVKAKVGFGADQLWYWRLPDDHPARLASCPPEVAG